MTRVVTAILTLIAFTMLGDRLFADEPDDKSENIVILDQLRSATQAEGLDAWRRIYGVFSHPRCVNCHVGETNIPLWTSSDGSTTRAHGMRINAGDSRIGAETLLCSNCHQTTNKPNTVPHAAPHTGMIWRLAPVEFQWTNRDSLQICEQVRNPETNGGRDARGLIDHIVHDASLFGFISWGFDPGPGRSTPPGTIQTHLEDMKIWVSAGMPCLASESPSATLGGSMRKTGTLSK
ncbi:MAG: hypothetical protein AAFY56_07990 [Pseudomonadota bacterium]